MPRPLISTTFVTTDTGVSSLLVGGTPGGTTGTGDSAQGPILLANETPSSTTNKLYNASSVLMFNGAPVGSQIFLHGGTFDTTSAGPTNLDTYTFSATTTDVNHLTALDTLVVYLSYYTTSGGSASGIWLRENAGAVDIWGSSGGGDNLGQSVNAWGSSQITLKLADATGLKRIGSSGMVASATPSLVKAATMSVNYTSAWTIALRFTGTAAGTVTAGWSIYRVLGQ